MRSKPVRYIFTILSSCMLAVIILFIILNFFFIDCRRVWSGSMADTLLHGDYILSWRLVLTPQTKQPPLHYRDIVIFKLPGRSEALIKRIIGLPGDTVALTPLGVFVNGKYLNEPYLRQSNQYPEKKTFSVAPGQLFVLGDNRPVSWDSEDFGTIPFSAVKGKVFFIYYPFARCRWLP